MLTRIIETKLQEQIKKGVQKRAKATKTQLATFNKLCGDIGELIKCGKAPAGATTPLKLPTKDLFQLDIDSDIWFDVGLDGAPNTPPPAWAVNEDVKVGIRMILSLDRCDEEQRRLEKEFLYLKEYARSEWMILEAAHQSVVGESTYSLC